MIKKKGWVKRGHRRQGGGMTKKIWITNVDELKESTNGKEIYRHEELKSKI